MKAYITSVQKHLHNCITLCFEKHLYLTTHPSRLAADTKAAPSAATNRTPHTIFLPAAQAKRNRIKRT